MNVLILTNSDHEEFVYKITEKYANEHIIIALNNKADFERFARSFSYDVGISFMYLSKVPKEQIDTHPWFNFHPAPLPEYGGRNLCYHAIMNGAKEFGTTIHYMNEGFDTGDIIEVWKFDIQPWDTAGDVSEAAIAFAGEMLVQYFPRILAGEQFQRLPNVGGRYYPKKEIPDHIVTNSFLKKRVRAITYGDFYPKIDVDGVTYKIVKDE